MTFFGVIDYIIICSLTTCRVTAADDLTTFPQLSLGLKAVSSISTVRRQTFTAQRRQAELHVLHVVYYYYYYYLSALEVRSRRGAIQIHVYLYLYLLLLLLLSTKMIKVA